MGNVLRGGIYPLCVGAERTLQARKVADVARRLGAQAVAHGCTAAGNDQVRFEVALRTLAPDLEILAPIRDEGFSREQEVKALADWGFDVPAQRAAYSVNRGLWGSPSAAARRTTPSTPLPEDAWVLTRGAFDRPRAPEVHEIGFERGVPVSIDGERLAPVALIERLDALAAPFGIGRGIHLGDTIFGLKGRVAFEAPAATVLILAHRELEKLELTARQQRLKDLVAASYGDWVHEGQFLEPACRDAEALLALVAGARHRRGPGAHAPGLGLRRRRPLAALAQGRLARRSTAKPRANGPRPTRAGSRASRRCPACSMPGRRRRRFLKTVLLDKIGSVALNCRLSREVRVSPDIPCVEGGVIAVRVLTSKSTYNQLELPSGRFSQIKPGDVIAGALGHRKALFGFSGHLPTTLAPGRQDQHPEPRRRARDLRQRQRRTSASRSRARSSARSCTSPTSASGSASRRTSRIGAMPPDDQLNVEGIPVVALVGSCMNAGKTAAACSLIQEFARRGLKVVAGKTTGVSLRRDILAMEDAGARASAIFTDLGIVTTTPAVAPQAARTLLTQPRAARSPDVIVLELGRRPARALRRRRDPRRRGPARDLRRGRARRERPGRGVGRRPAAPRASRHRGDRRHRPGDRQRRRDRAHREAVQTSRRATRARTRRARRRRAGRTSARPRPRAEEETTGGS